MELQAEESLLGLQLTPEHALLLRRWNGLDLDVVRILGCGETEAGIDSLRDNQDAMRPQLRDQLIFASDPAGFIYAQARNGKVSSVDTDGGTVKVIASSVDDLICRHIFGQNAHLFAGQEWLAELKRAGVLDFP